MIADTSEHKHYYAVIFTSVRTDVDDNYAETSDRMVELAAQQPGFLGVEAARSELGITISYWKDEESIRAWKMHAEHSIARESGRREWYKAYCTRICRVEREYGYEKDDTAQR